MKHCTIFKHVVRAFTLICFFALPALPQQPTTFTSFTPGGVWLADDGKHIDCHAGNILYSTQTKRYYWFGEHRGSPGGVACYSSGDLYNWKNEGLAMPKGTIAVLERPKVAYNATTKKYVLWFHYDNSGYGLAHLGVASSDSIKGPYTLVDNFLPNGHDSRDMGMFCDDNGKVYIIYSSAMNTTVRIVELTADYLNVTANDVVTGAHCEGPGMLKINGTYYLMTSLCSGWTPNKANYYTATSATGPFTSKGDPCVGDTNHTTFNSQPCSILKIQGYTNAFMYLGDRWNGAGSVNSQYVFLPITITVAGAMQLKWAASWTLQGFFTPGSIAPKNVFNFKTAVFANAANNTGLHVFDLLGRKQMTSWPLIGNKDKTIYLKNSDASNTVKSSGEYILR
jgi:beta-galactosidase